MAAGFKGRGEIIRPHPYVELRDVSNVGHVESRVTLVEAVRRSQDFC